MYFIENAPSRNPHRLVFEILGEVWFGKGKVQKANF